MLLSHRKKFIFIHINKTAGTSVMDVFAPYSRFIDRMAYDYEFTRKMFGLTNRLMGWHNDGMKQFTGFHKHATADVIKEKLGDELFDSYYKFSFVRNPFDFLVSMYFYARQFPQDSKRRDIRAMQYSDFLKRYISVRPRRQVDFITDPHDSKVLVDHIGRFETLESDIAIIQKTLDLENRRSIKHKNRSPERESQDYKVYYDEESRHLVEKYFQRDLDLLGYNFYGIDENARIMQ